MADNTFDSEELDIQFQPITAYIDGDGSFKLNTPMLSSLDFDGSIPKVEDEALPVVDVMPGYFIKLEEDGDYFVVESVEVDEEFIDSTGLVTINYIDDQGQIISVDYDDTDTVHVMYEDWAEKILGTRGWGITSGGNAIFTNVAVRGRIEAEEGYISGTLTIGDGGATTLDDVATTDDLTDFITETDVSITGTTSIYGGRISTGQIQSGGYSGGSVLGTSFSTSGAAFNLDYGSITTPNFRVDYLGNAYFKGGIDASTITGSSISIKGYIAPLLFVDNSSVTQASISLISRTSRSLPSVTTTWLNLDANYVSVESRLDAQTIGANYFYGDGSNLTNVTAASLASGTYGISITGNAATATTANNISAYTINQNVGTGNSPTFANITSNGSISAGGIVVINSGRAITCTGITNNTAGTSYLMPASFTNHQDNLEIRTSDGRLGVYTSTIDIKTDVIPLIGEQLSCVTNDKDGGSRDNLIADPDSIFNVTPVEYTVIEDPDAYRQVGFIVEDLVETYPQAVTYKDGKPFSYNTSPIVAGLVYAVKTLKNKVDSLESRVIQLESQLGG